MNMLEHLIVYPLGGLCNKMRAIASAKRLCAQARARCTIAWEWGDYQDLFDDSADWFAYDPQRDTIPEGYFHIVHALRHHGGKADNRRVPTTGYSKIAVTTYFVFSAAEEPPFGCEEKIFSWLPKPHPIVLEKAKEFRNSYFTGKVAGIHMRRADARFTKSPDEAFFEEADRALDDGFVLFLATDNAATLRLMHNRYGAKLLYRPKRSERVQRWPRRDMNPEDFIDDMIDLWLLAGCDYVVGCSDSSYSKLAMLLNGSQLCRSIN
jgi:hypothetical protein